MKVEDILQIKGSDVKTVRPDTSARELAVRLHVEIRGSQKVVIPWQRFFARRF
jgi:hypothetical protein